MRVVVAPDKFKGSLTAAQVAESVALGLRTAAPDVEVLRRPVADGGDGTVDAALAAGFHAVDVMARGPTGQPGAAQYARSGDTAVIELARICGLLKLAGGVPDPLGATSLGVGDAIRHALASGCTRIVLGLGGSASTDGGAGMLVALGASIRDASGGGVPSGGGSLGAVAAVDLSALMPEAAAAELVVACDVDSPLFGPNGAAYVFGPQKGADPAQVEVLDAGLRRWAKVLAAATADSTTVIAGAAGAGAAGGVAFAAEAALGATLRPGIELVLDLVGFGTALRGADLVITGEGSLDEQTLAGKAPAGVAAAARRAGVPCIAIAGRSVLSAERLHAVGIEAVYTLTQLEPDPVRCMADASRLVARVAEIVGRDQLPGPGRSAPG